MTDRDAQIEALNADNADKAAQIDTLKAAAAERDKEIETLKTDAADKTARIEAMNADAAEKANQIDTLKAAVSDRDKQIEALNADVTDKNAQIEDLNTENADKATQINTITAGGIAASGVFETQKAAVGLSESGKEPDEPHEVKTENGTYRLTVAEVRKLDGDLWQMLAKDKGDHYMIIAVHGEIENVDFTSRTGDTLPASLVTEEMEVKDQAGTPLVFFHISGGSDGEYAVNPDVRPGTTQKVSYTYFADKDLTEVSIRMANGETLTVPVAE